MERCFQPLCILYLQNIICRACLSSTESTEWPQCILSTFVLRSRLVLVVCHKCVEICVQTRVTKGSFFAACMFVLVRNVPWRSSRAPTHVLCVDKALKELSKTFIVVGMRMIRKLLQMPLQRSLHALQVLGDRFLTSLQRGIKMRPIWWSLPQIIYILPQVERFCSSSLSNSWHKESLFSIHMKTALVLVL